MATVTNIHKTKCYHWLIGIFLSVSLCITGAYAENLAVIVNPAIDLDKVDKKAIINIFMGRQNTLDGRTTAIPLDIDNDSKMRAIFYKNLVDRDLAEVNSYWARLLFSGKSSPPRKLSSTKEVLAAVADNKSAIGYVPVTQINDQVKVVYLLSQ